MWGEMGRDGEICPPATSRRGARCRRTLSRPPIANSSAPPQVGKVQAYAQDASFASFSWAASLRPRWAGGTGEGVLAAPKEVATGQALIMALTSTPMPDLVAAAGGEQDWSKIFWAADGEQRAQLDEVYVQFQDRLRAFSAKCQEVNEDALAAFESGQQNVAGKPLVNFGLWSHDPQYLETSVSI